MSPLTNKFNQAFTTDVLQGRTPKAGTSFLIAPINYTKNTEIRSFNKTNRQCLIDEVDKYIIKKTEHLKHMSPDKRKKEAKIKSPMQLRAEFLSARFNDNLKGVKSNGRNLSPVNDKVYQKIRKQQIADGFGSMDKEQELL